MEIPRSLFDIQRHRRFGSRNPERMQLAYWEWIIRNGLNAYQALKRLGAELDPERGPDWCFAQRYGMTRTELSDGRIIHIGGEYEDSYDAEFCIYNDVVVRGPGDAIEIYGYPREAFPPTDFHTATLLDQRIIVIGRLGYPNERIGGSTPVFVLDSADYTIEKLNTSRENPGWLFKHSAQLEFSRQIIRIDGGFVMADGHDGWVMRRNFDSFELDLRDWSWHPTTRRQWRQFRIDFFDADGRRAYPEPPFDPDFCLPKAVPYETFEDDGSGSYRCYRINVDGVAIRLWDDLSEIAIAVEGQLDEAALSHFLHETATNTQAYVRLRCDIVAL